jgi:hypothetical protein
MTNLRYDEDLVRSVGECLSLNTMQTFPWLAMSLAFVSADWVVDLSCRFRCETMRCGW